MDKLGIVWHIHEEQVNHPGNLLPMLVLCIVPAVRCCGPAPNKVCNHNFFIFLTQYIVHFSQTVHVSGDDAVAQDGHKQVAQSLIRSK